MTHQDEITKTTLTTALVATAVVTTSERIGCGATVVATLADAQEQVRLTLQQQLLPQTEQQAPPERDEIVRPRAHPSIYSPSIDVRSSLKNDTVSQ